MCKKGMLFILIVSLGGHFSFVGSTLAQLTKEERPVNVYEEAEVYKLIFAEVYQGKRFSIGEKEFDEHRRSRLQNFALQLNQAGSKNYRLISAIRAPAAIVRIDEGQYKYGWFETVSPVHFAKNGLVQRLEDLGKEGLRIREHSPI